MILDLHVSYGTFFLIFKQTCQRLRYSSTTQTYLFDIM